MGASATLPGAAGVDSLEIGVMGLTETRRVRLFPLRRSVPVCLPYVRTALRTRLLHLARLELQGFGVPRRAFFEELFGLVAAAARVLADRERFSVPRQLYAEH